MMLPFPKVSLDVGCCARYGRHKAGDLTRILSSSLQCRHGGTDVLAQSAVFSFVSPDVLQEEQGVVVDSALIAVPKRKGRGSESWQSFAS